MALSIAEWHLREVGELLLDSLVWIVHARGSLPLHVLALALSNAPLLLNCVGECRAVVRLATRLCRALLVLPTDEGIDMSCVLLLGCHLRLLVEALRPVALLDTCHSQIMVVSLEKFLNAGPLELGLVLEHLLGVRVLPLAVRVLGIEVVFGGGRHKGGLHALLTETFPVEVGEPRVFPQHVRTFLPEAVTRFSLDQSVDKIGSIGGPVLRNFILVDLDLFGKDMVTNLLPVLAVVGSLAEHALIGDDAHGEVVDGHAVVLAAHDLRSHIARRA